jgi:GH43 family beta-xylosidase
MVLFHTLRRTLLLLAPIVLPGQSFTNPVFASQDPYVVRWHGNYYYSDSDGDTIYLRKSATLTGLKDQAPKAIWTSPQRGSDGHANVWAPEIHEVNGKWYIYFAADYHTDGRHRLYVLEGGTDPLDPYHVADTGAPSGQIVESTGRWAIDPNVFFGPDHSLYLTWSCTDDDIGKTAQSLCIARMSDALHLGSSTVRISSPTEAWETRTGAIQEGPIGFVRNGNTYVTYSASASWTTSDYAVGVLINRSGDLLDPNAWTKRGPILESHGNTYGPGSVVFVESPDATELWALYHAYDRLDCSAWACRSIRMQKVTWDADGTPLMGYPVDPNVPMRVPSGEGN